jgi:hypothetical protein
VNCASQRLAIPQRDGGRGDKPEACNTPTAWRTRGQARGLQYLNGMEDEGGIFSLIKLIVEDGGTMFAGFFVIL